MRSDLTGVVVVLGLSALVGCLGDLSRAPPGRMPMPEPWQPHAVFSANLSRSQPGHVVLDERDGLSPDEAAILAVDQNPALRAVRARRGIARAEVLRAGILPNPMLAGNVDAPVAGPYARVLGYGVGLSWNVTPLISRAPRVEGAQENVAAVDLEVAWQEWQVGQAARLHTIRLIYLNRRIVLTRQAEDVWQQRVDRLLQAGATHAVTEIAVARAQRSFADWTMVRQNLERERVGEQSALAEALGVDLAHVPIVQTSWRPNAHAPPANDLLASLTERRLDLIALQHAQRSHDEALRAAALERFPPIEVGVRVSREVDKAASVGFALRFGIPVLNRNQGGVERERARRGQIEDEYDARLLAARSQVIRYSQELTILREQLKSATAAEAAAVRLSDLARSSGAASALDVMVRADIDDRAFAARLRTFTTKEALLETRVALSVSSGLTVP